MTARRTDLISARSPRGFADRGPAEIAATREMSESIRKVYELWGFEALETPFFEYTDALGKFLPDQDRPNAGVFSLQDDDDQWMSLRYDLTAPLARHVAENFQKLAKPYRGYRFGPVFRNEKPGPGRFRQFLQFDADIVGAASVTADAEMCMMMADAIEAVGIKRGDYVIKVNNRKVLDGLMESIGIGGDDNAGRRLIVLRAIDKLDRLGVEGVKALLGAGRKDESGDFTKGAELGASEIEAIGFFFGMHILKDPEDSYLEFWTQRIDEMASAMKTSVIGLEGIAELRAMATAFTTSKYDDGRIEITSSVVRGLEYYTGPVYEAELTFKINDEDGRPIQFGSVGGGGRYDGLVGRFMSEDTPATGFSIGVSRLQAALKALKGDAAEKPAGPVVVLVMDKDRVGDSMAMAAKLRAAGITAEAYLGSSGMKAQMKYADRRNSPCVVIQGSDERDKGEVTLKDLVAGAKAAAAIADRAEWTESRPAQVTVAETDLVTEVRKILGRQS